MNHIPNQQYHHVQQQPIIKPPILPPKATYGVANSSNGSRTAILPENNANNIIVLQKQQLPYFAPPFYENIQDVATSSKYLSYTHKSIHIYDIIYAKIIKHIALDLKFSTIKNPFQYQTP